MLNFRGDRFGKTVYLFKEFNLMAKWDKESFIEDMQSKCNREVTKIGKKIIEFSENNADEITWGRGTEHGTLTYRAESDFGVLSVFHLTSEGKINLQINFLREKNLPPQVMRDLTVKLESNFLLEFDEEMYPIDVFTEVEDLFHTTSQIDKFIKAIETFSYRLRQ